MLRGKEIAATKGVISTESPLIARIGAAILENGSNAMDALVSAESHLRSRNLRIALRTSG